MPALALGARLLTIAWLVMGCATTSSTVSTQSGTVSAEARTSPTHERLHAVLWMQRSAEYDANAMQAFRVAKENLARALDHPDTWTDAVPFTGDDRSKFSIIVDLDETVLDNTPAEVEAIRGDVRTFDEDKWKAWEAMASATLVPGAREFLQWAGERGVRIFYVTNRVDEPQTKRNLVDLGCPLAEGEDTLLMPDDCPGKSTDKGCRRELVASKYRVLLSIGDDFRDFMSLSGSADERIQRAQEQRERWGREWIILPNPSYGSWERAFYDPSKDAGDVILQKKYDALTGPNDGR